MGKVIDEFIDLRRGRLSLLEFCNEFEFRYEEANTIGGYNTNDVGRSHLLLKYCGLASDMRDHIILLSLGNLGDYDGIMERLVRMAKTQSYQGQSWNGQPYFADDGSQAHG